MTGLLLLWLVFCVLIFSCPASTSMLASSPGLSRQHNESDHPHFSFSFPNPPDRMASKESDSQASEAGPWEAAEHHTNTR